ncbi:MAG: hypothetical protein CMC76_12035 [Flavobacteriaceae bacterium]|nr:hypothetical protein [Flavobacteriaceae bacterium]|tara:strand:+ start:2551 stop:2772 length:222 start_codon:yes stop_codon:yes gene_type:complete
MGKLIFEGDDKVLAIVSKDNRLRAKKYGLKVTLETKESKITIPSKEDSTESKPKKKSSTVKKSDDKSKKPSKA